MESCGKEFDTDQDLPKDIKDMGIGRPATRASIIERIIQVEYISRDKKTLIPTEKGIKLYLLIKDFDIASAKMTGAWESKLNAIAEGNYKYEDFMELVENNFRSKTLPDLLKLKGTFKGETIQCPKCSKQSLQARGKVFRCAENTCDFILFQNYFGKKITIPFLNKIFNKEKIEVKGLVYKTKKFDAILYFNTEELKIKHEYKDTTTSIVCPKCKQGKLIKHQKGFFGCNQYSTLKCDFTIWEKQFGKKLSLDEVKQLCTTKKTQQISGFKSTKTKKSYTASIELKEDFKTGLVFDNKKKK
jgi:ssDNA-binding Zn-finger/Zn-ribbon topoisomerase 1